nr:RNA-directed DNA polymerase, eukaryota [Tanacetum cinerariifolium]
MSKKTKIMTEAVFYTSWWMIWWFRNSKIYKEKAPKKACFFYELQKLWLIQMARRVSDYRIRRIADRGNEEDGPDSQLELQREMRKKTESRYVVRDDVNEEEEYPSFDSYPRSFEPINPDIFSEDEPRFDEEEVVNIDYEEAPVFDDDPYEAKTENIFAQQDI